MNPFKCSKCGQCCTGFLQKNRDVVPPLEGDLTINLVPIGITGVTLFPWEVEPLVAGAKQHGKQVKVIPGKGLLCKAQKTVLVIDYFLRHPRCPLLSDSNECLIYQNRPLTCRSFPINSSGLLGDRFRKGNCPQYVNPFGKTEVINLNVEVEMTTFYKTFGEIYLSRLKAELIYDVIRDFTIQLRARGVLHLDLNSEELQRSRFRDYRWQDLLQFLHIPPKVIWESKEDLLTVQGMDRTVWNLRPNPFSYIREIYQMSFPQVRGVVAQIFVQRQIERQVAVFNAIDNRRGIRVINE
jgi:Fe-S-cluster containining protein